MTSTWLRVVALAPVMVLALVLEAGAQTEHTSGAGASAVTQGESDPDLDLDRAQPDFTLVNLPTALRLPRFKSAFRVTHRFARPLGAGDFGSLLEDFFGLDAGSQIGLEYRFGLLSGTQVGIHRTSNRTIEFFAQQDVIAQRPDSTAGLAIVATVDGTNNFRDSYSPAIGGLLSYRLGEAGVVYAMPMWVNNSNPLPTELVDSNDTFMLGLGARLRLRPTVYVVGEFTPRLAGYDPGSHLASFGIEKRAGGHAFQLNFSNGFGTTMAQVARGGTASDDWYIGFNISRKFF